MFRSHHSQIHFLMVIQDTALPTSEDLKAKVLPLCQLRAEFEKSSLLPSVVPIAAGLHGPGEALEGHCRNRSHSLFPRSLSACGGNRHQANHHSTLCRGCSRGWRSQRPALRAARKESLCAGAAVRRGCFRECEDKVQLALERGAVTEDRRSAV